jgi:ribonucleoside-diphosphate reductase alpha subunit
MDEQEMRVKKRSGNFEDVSFDKILNRVKSVGSEAGIQINYSMLVMKIIDQLYDGIDTTKIDELTAEHCASQSTTHIDYSTLAGRMIVSNHHKNTGNSFKAVTESLYDFKDIHGIKCSLIDKKYYDNVMYNIDKFEKIINYDRDYLIDYFGFKTLERAYLFKINGKIIERPQHMWLRVSIAIHGRNIDKIKETYNLMSLKYFTHATPTLFNSGMKRNQLSSCFLMAMESDSIDGIYNTLKDCANISKYAGGIGLHIHNVRAKGSHIRGTNGTSNGIVPMLRVFNNTARYVDQGGGKRNGSFAIYLEPWHADIFDFLEMRKNHGDEELKARDLFYALWIPDLFMKRVKSGGKWTLMCPDECPGLGDVYGDDFDKLYLSYEEKSKGKQEINARDLWLKILDSQMETGTPYLLYKDSANKKSNQKNLGIIKSSNLCTEIIEYSDDKETAVCNLASIALSSFVNDDKTYNYKKLHNVSKIVTENLNKIIDTNYYPTEKTKLSNLKHRPIGIGVQGLADVFAKMDISFDSDQANVVNKKIFETIYHGALEMSNELAKKRCQFINAIYSSCYRLLSDKKSGIVPYKDTINNILTEKEWTDFHPLYEELNIKDTNLRGSYSSIEGSPCLEGILQFDLWNVEPSSDYDWNELKMQIKTHGLRNSLLLAPMPTASTSQILGNNECFEPFTSNIYSRRTIAGEFMIINKHLQKELIELNIWNSKIKNKIIENKGSIANIDVIPDKLKEKYKIVWEIPMKRVIDMSRDRGAFICQSQSLNLWQSNPNYKSLTSMHFYGWEQGLKTGMYYLRRKAKHQAQQFTIEPSKVEDNDEDEVCELCSS